VDSYDVITHDRPYKQAIDPAEALNEIRKNAGIQYDPFLADVFINVMLES
jgi:HD-GYP domain-containing protein (c-di-GMP phosphodiesterase class II)